MKLLPKKLNTKVLIRILGVLAIILLPIILTFSFFVYYHGKIFPNVRVANVDLGGLTKSEAQEKLSNNLKVSSFVILETKGDIPNKHQIPSDSINANIDYHSSIENAYAHGRTSALFSDISTVLDTAFTSKVINPTINYDEILLDEQLSAYAESITTQPVYPEYSLQGNEVLVSTGEAGSEINLELLKKEVIKRLKEGSSESIIVDITKVDPSLNEYQILDAKLRANKLLNKSISFEFEGRTFDYVNQTLLAFLNPTGGYYEDKIESEADKIANEVERAPQNPVFSFAEGRVQEFKPSKDGIELNRMKFTALLQDGLMEVENEEFSEITHTLPVNATSPSISMNDVNDLGIKELIGRGTSEFKGSIASRVYNIQLASSRINGVLIKPGEEFSFNGALGDVSALTGYKQAYVIQGGRTVLGDGGGVCQVSTTFFRAALNAGLPILERNPHSYRVGYYEQDSGPGLDASIYVPTLDLKIKNDTPGHILVQAIPDVANSTLTFEFYGTSDGRESFVSKPVISSTSAPPEPEYTDDPNLPTGQVKQVDYAAWGARTHFDYKVVRDGETLIERTFTSNYRPWSAKYIRGTGPAI